MQNHFLYNDLVSFNFKANNLLMSQFSIQLQYYYVYWNKEVDAIKEGAESKELAMWHVWHINCIRIFLMLICSLGFFKAQTIKGKVTYHAGTHLNRIGSMFFSSIICPIIFYSRSIPSTLLCGFHRLWCQMFVFMHNLTSIYMLTPILLVECFLMRNLLAMKSMWFFFIHLKFNKYYWFIVCMQYIASSYCLF